MSIHVTIAAHLIPQMGTPGDIWVPKDCRRIYFVGRNGKTVDITCVLDGVLGEWAVAINSEVHAVQDTLGEFLAQNAHAQEYLNYLKSKREKKTVKRLSNDEILDARSDDNEFPPNTVGRQQADFVKSNEAAQRSMDARIAAAVADGKAAPLWSGPRLNITEARRQAHAKLSAAPKQRN